MTEVLRDLIGAAVLEANVANMRGAFMPFGLLPGAEVHDGADMFWSISNIPLQDFNTVIDTHLGPENLRDAIEAAKARCTSRDVLMLWHVAPTDRPADLGYHLEASGFEHLVDVPVMALDLQTMSDQPHHPRHLLITRAIDGKTAKQWASTMSRAFGLASEAMTAVEGVWERVVEGPDRDRFELLVGRVDGEPVATAELVLHAGVAGIYSVATLPEARRRGIGTAMSVAACGRARELGYGIAVLQSSKMGVGIYQALGFQVYGQNRKYVWSPPALTGI